MENERARQHVSTHAKHPSQELVSHLQTIGDKTKEILLTNATFVFFSFKLKINDLLSMCPSPDVMNDPAILSQPDLQQKVSNNDKKDAIPVAVAEVASGRRSFSQMCQAMVNLFAADKLLPFSQILSDAKTAINVGRTTVGVEFFLREMNALDFAKISGEDAKAWAEGVEKQLSAKGCKMPEAFNDLIQTVKKNGLAEEKEGDEKESAAEPATKKANTAS